jgi:serine/threonine-protein kinase RsbW
MENNQINVDIKVPNQTRYLSLIGKIGEDIARELDKCSADNEMLSYHLNLVLTEAMANAINYASAGDPDGMVHISINITPDEITIKVYDYGQGFDINAISPPNFEELEDRGRGIFIIRSLMDSVNYHKLGNGNVLEMAKKLR